MNIYLVSINPHQKSEWGGTSYKNIIVVSNLNISPENLRILVHKELDVPYFKLYQFMFHEANTEKDMYDNIVVEKLNLNILKLEDNKNYIKNELAASEFYELQLLSNYEHTFPEGAVFLEQNIDWCMNLLEEGYTKAKNEDQTRQIEANKKQFLKFISEIDKSTLLELLQEAYKEQE